MELKYLPSGRYLRPDRVLIVPLWNWNKREEFDDTEAGSSNRTFMELKSDRSRWARSGRNVLIVPLWNWNVCPKNHPPYDACSNRTFMELKSRWWRRTAAWRTGSNRTFMELKLILSISYSFDVSCSNRTFMELKSFPAIPSLGSNKVLIVPLWNWNADARYPAE